jgi:hypothetical protein
MQHEARKQHRGRDAAKRSAGTRQRGDANEQPARELRRARLAESSSVTEVMFVNWYALTMSNT